MVIENGLLVADVVHKRTQPKENSFRYSVYYLAFPLQRMKELVLPFLALDRANLFSYRQTDHGDGRPNNEAWIRSILQEWQLEDVVTGDIELVTMPRLFGYGFNPVSFWFCLDEQRHLRAVVSEVQNTFGEKHCYVSYHDDKRPIESDDWMESQKIFHVSPFMTIEGGYQYRFIITDQKVAVWINHVTDEGVMLYTSLTGRRIPLSTKNLLYCFFRYPLVTFKVIGLIHWQALKLAIKGIKYHRKPTPPSQEITR